MEECPGNEPSITRIHEKTLKRNGEKCFQAASIFAIFCGFLYRSCITNNTNYSILIAFPERRFLRYEAKDNIKYDVQKCGKGKLET